MAKKDNQQPLPTPEESSGKMLNNNANNINNNSSTVDNKTSQQQGLKNKSLQSLSLLFLSDIAIFASILLHIMICPYTKVEESFNTQAIYDILSKKEIDEFDHVYFPGVVPRTFLGPCIVSTFIEIIQFILLPIMKIFSILTNNAPSDLLLMRFILGILSFLSFQYFKNGIKLKFNLSITLCFNIINLVQFHLLFYESRPLPNTFALMLIYLALGFWVRDYLKLMFFILGFTAVVFRSDVFVFIVPIALFNLITKRINLITGIFIGLFSIIIGILISIFVDSYYWQRLIWSEGEVFHYNTILNKSIHWGAMPFHWYFTSALPRALLLTNLFIPLGLYYLKSKYRKLLITMFLSSLLFIILYSFLPHKELRFIFFALPIFNLIAAIGLNAIFTSHSNFLKIIFATILLIGSLFASSLFLHVSSLNYYGAASLNKLHDYLENRNNNQNILIHMDSHVTMNGVSQYLYKSNYNYSKLEILENNSKNNIHYEMFTHLLTGNQYFNNTNFKLIGRQSGFKQLNLRKTILQNRNLNDLISIDTKIYMYERINAPDYLAPVTKWAQRKDKILLTIELSNASDLSIHMLTKDVFSFRARQLDKWYALDLKLFDNIIHYTFEPGIRWVKITLFKQKNYFWNHLLKDTNLKLQYVRKDWDNWVDSENEDDYKSELAFTNHLLSYREGHGTTETIYLKYLLRDERLYHNVLQFVHSWIENTTTNISPIQYARIVTICFMFALITLVLSTVKGSNRQQKEKQE
ncbi:hypothetical protein ABK040_006078 [Willaertia magna]